MEITILTSNSAIKNMKTCSWILIVLVMLIQSCAVKKPIEPSTVFQYDKQEAVRLSKIALEKFDAAHFKNNYSMTPFLIVGQNTTDCDKKITQAVMVAFKGKGEKGLAIVVMTYEDGRFKKYHEYGFQLITADELETRIRERGLRLECESW